MKKITSYKNSDLGKYDDVKMNRDKSFILTIIIIKYYLTLNLQ